MLSRETGGRPGSESCSQKTTGQRSEELIEYPMLFKPKCMSRLGCGRDFVHSGKILKYDKATCSFRILDRGQLDTKSPWLSANSLSSGSRPSGSRPHLPGNMCSTWLEMTALHTGPRCVWGFGRATQPGICGIVGKMAHDSRTGASDRNSRRAFSGSSRALVQQDQNRPRSYCRNEQDRQSV